MTRIDQSIQVAGEVSSGLRWAAVPLIIQNQGRWGIPTRMPSGNDASLPRYNSGRPNFQFGPRRISHVRHINNQNLCRIPEWGDGQVK
jgi:hypothetical protein